MSNGFAVKDHGVREEMKTGSRRDTQKGKPRYDLVPASVVTKLALHYAAGSEKYGDFNWQKGQPITRYMSSAERHFQYFKMGLTDENHLIACIWNLFAIDWTLDAIADGRLPRELDDRPQDMKPGCVSNENLFKKIEENVVRANTPKGEKVLDKPQVIFNHETMNQGVLDLISTLAGMRSVTVSILPQEAETGDLKVAVIVPGADTPLGHACFAVRGPTETGGQAVRCTSPVYFSVTNISEYANLSALIGFLDQSKTPFCIASKGMLDLLNKRGMRIGLKAYFTDGDSAWAVMKHGFICGYVPTHGNNTRVGTVKDVSYMLSSFKKILKVSNFTLEIMEPENAHNKGKSPRK